jgi:hypothetical protein
LGLFSAEELMTTREYLRSLYGNRLPTREEEETWMLSETEMYYRSAIFAMNNYIKIADKNRNIVPFRPYAGQAILDVCIEAQLREGLPQRVVGFKPRQVGWTTRMLGRSCHHVTSGPNRRAMFLVPDEEVANDKALVFGTMLNSLPRFLQPMRRLANMKHVQFDNPNPKERMTDPGLNSSMQITVPSSMRGMPPEMLTISEYAHMKEHEQYLVTTGILPAMATSSNTCAVIDTTPNGYDTFYEPLVREAYDSNKKWMRKLELSNRSFTAQEILAGAIGAPDNLYDSSWLLAYVRWDWHEEYAARCKEFPMGEARKPPPQVWRGFQADIGKNPMFGEDEEITLREKFGLKDEQLYWRRQKIKSFKVPSVEMRLATFHQEFSMSVEEGFVQLEMSPFDHTALQKLIAMRRDPIAEGLLIEENGVIGVRHSLASAYQRWRVYVPPSPGDKYAIGVDTNQAYGSLESDPSAVVVMRYRDRKVCAVYTGHVPGHVLREQVFLAYRFYLRAYLGVETAGMGYQLVRDLVDMGVSNFYSWKRLDRTMPEPSEYPGWQTDDRTRPIMDSKFIEHLCYRDPVTYKVEPKFNIPDYETIKQIQGIRRGATGSLKSAHGKDDIFDAICICLCLFDDPFGGFHKPQVETPPQEQAEEFKRLFRGINGGTFDRNRPNLANI